MLTAVVLALLLLPWVAGEQELAQLHRFVALFPQFPLQEFLNQTVGCVERHYDSHDWDEKGPPRGCGLTTHYFLGLYFNTKNYSEFVKKSDLASLAPSDAAHYASMHHILTNLHAGREPLDLSDLNNSTVQSCQYSVDVATTFSAPALHPYLDHLLRLPLELNVTIHQLSCQPPSAWLNGGSSFSFLAHSPLVHMDCTWTDFHTAPSPQAADRYVFRCQIYFDHYYYSRIGNSSQVEYITHEPLQLNAQHVYLHRTAKDTRLCFQYALLLDYEAYRAYSEISGPPLGREIYQDSLCTEVTAWLTDRGALQPHTALVSASPLSALTPYGPATAAVTRCLTDRLSFFVGASHMRYLWDELMLHYLHGKRDLLQLPPHHGDEVVPGTSFHYYRNYFFWTVPRTLQAFCHHLDRNLSSLPRNNNTASPPRAADWFRDVDWAVAQAHVQPVHVLVQAGAWDHHFFSARAVSHHVAAVVHTLRSLSARPCSAFLHLHLATTVPMPLCGDNATRFREMYPAHKLCGRDRGYRVNAAMAAVGQQLLRGLREAVRYPGPAVRSWMQATDDEDKARRLRAVDVFAWMAPFHSKAVCGVHYMCPHRVKASGAHSAQDVWQQNTTAGLVARNAVLHSLCAEETRG